MPKRRAKSVADENLQVSTIKGVFPLIAFQRLVVDENESALTHRALVSAPGRLGRLHAKQPLGTATRMKTPNAEADFEMYSTDKGDFNLGSGRPAEDQYGSYRAPSEPLEMQL